MCIYYKTHTDIRVDWQVFNIVQEDSDVVDLITTIGPAFPKYSPSHHPAPSPPSIVDQRPCDGVRDSGLEPGHGDTSESVREEFGLDSDPVVHVVLRGHEGVQANRPFTVHPTQMVCSLTHMCVTSSIIKL